VSSRVQFLGERTDVGDILHAADIYCQPNIKREPFGIALVEAMSCGLPVVTTELGSTADPVGPSIGRQVGAEAGQLATSLAELIESRQRREELGAGARARYIERHSPDLALRDLVDAFKRCIEANSRTQGG
jgi:glycosyltransferase involved in cell wall biosynthesis